MMWELKDAILGLQKAKKKREREEWPIGSWWCLLFDTLLCTKQFLSHFSTAASKGKKEFEQEKKGGKET